MHPVLFEFGNFTIYTYAFLVDLGIIVGASIAYLEARRLGYDKETFFDLAVWVIASAIVGARLYQVFFLVWDFYSQDLFRIIRLWEGGLVFQGALLGGIAGGFFYLWRRKLSFWLPADFTALGLVFGHAIGRLGCFFAGCCYGDACTLPWAVEFPATPNIPRHPTQLYEAIANLAIFAVLFLVRKRKPFDGFVFLLYVMLYSSVRFALEFFRGDTTQMIGSFRLAQIVSMGTFVLAAAFIVVLMGRNKNADFEASDSDPPSESGPGPS
jgi:phosphatidylglycerol:prolipoprotein diacylglycerol transferase